MLVNWLRRKTMNKRNVLSGRMGQYEKSEIYVMRCAIWYHLYNLKNVKNTDGRVLLLVKLQA